MEKGLAQSFSTTGKPYKVLSAQARAAGASTARREACALAAAEVAALRRQLLGLVVQGAAPERDPGVPRGGRPGTRVGRAGVAPGKHAGSAPGAQPGPKALVKRDAGARAALRSSRKGAQQ